MKNLFGIRYICLLVIFLSASVHAAPIIGIFDNGNLVYDYGSGGNNTSVRIDYINQELVYLYFRPYLTEDTIEFRINNKTGTGWANFTIEIESLDNFSAPSFRGRIIIPDTTTFTLVRPATDIYQILFDTPESSGFSITARSENDLREYRIKLQPEAVPLPASVWLFVSGLLGMVCIVRRERAV